MSFSFVSVFKINGVPILPPLMTPEVCAEVSEYRKKALEIEKNIKKSTKPDDASCCRDQTNNSEATEKPSSPPDDPTAINRRNSFTLATPSLGSVDLPHSTSPINCYDALQKFEGSDNTSPRPRIRSNSFTVDCPSPLLIKHLHNQSLDVKSSFSMGEIPMSDQTKHVKKLDFESDVKTKTPIKPVGKPKLVTDRKVSSAKSQTAPKRIKSPYESVSKTSIKINSRTKPSTPKKNSTINVGNKTDSKVLPATSICQQKIRDIQKQQEQRMLKLLKRQEEEQRQLQESFRRQHEEIAKMLLQSVDQIHTSTPKIGSPEDSKSNLPSNEASQMGPSFRKLNISSKDFVQNSDTQSSISNLSSSKTLFVSSNSSKSSVDFEESDEMYKTCNNSSNNNRWKNDEQIFSDVRSYMEIMQQTLQDKDLQELSGFSKQDHPILKQDEHIKYNAACLINAYARGYLTRRLFQTEKVQKIVQIIRDTLLFILDMHHENAASGRRIRSSADVQLKRTLVHQLTSACNQLHEIFIDSTIQQRMHIIRRDREQMKLKLENRIRTVAVDDTNKVTNHNPAILPEQYQTLQVCSLYRQSKRQHQP
ncbi:centriolar coiled-coil protein of 110 kDa isoform X2 [Wyeomyia smithii]|uniref:centriolar coiled-coil protein of 110 kDa isoform X2 n=1 Tax=Wyeomyia smithii TaxID=174621 RepID=UPI002467ADF7|nr:centriolar coiled-coil protein of 110 kDa isoform X2 [Wyeomyia smithii]